MHSILLVLRDPRPMTTVFPHTPCHLLAAKGNLLLLKKNDG